jgi:alanine dehydrogenase
MIRFISEEDVAATLDVAGTIDLLESAARALAAGTASVTPRQRPFTTGVRMNLMGAGLDGRIGHKCYPIGKGHANFVVTLYGDDAKMLALIQANRLGQVRTGAATGLATRLMARPDAKNVAIFGTGWQARTQLEAVCRARPSIKFAHAIGRTADHTQKFCTEMSALLGISVMPALDVAAAVGEADVVITMTSSTQPVLLGAMLSPGTHVNAAGSNRATAAEIDADVVRRAGIVVVEDIAQAKAESGDLLDAEKAGTWDWSRATLLSDVVTGKAPARTSADQITLFESLGIALWDIAAANHIYDQCVKTGRGREIDLPI